MNIVLTGFMASGKTSIAKAIAGISDYKYIDTDDMITSSEGRSINEIFKVSGEAEFRRIEREAVRRAAELSGHVISTGGGVPLDAANIRALRKNGIIVNLAPDFSVIEARIKSAAATRPLLRDRSIDEIRARFEARKPFYDDCDVKIKVSNEVTPKEYAKEIIKKCEEFSRVENE
ncbi:MAG: shikimate kinase [Clostridia bacterium]|nr:shikimate kinase [Clostridia bacterium]